MKLKLKHENKEGRVEFGVQRGDMFLRVIINK